jgi:hypothetical protein
MKKELFCRLYARRTNAFDASKPGIKLGMLMILLRITNGKIRDVL